jgi:dTDP-4-amino-4,6-dideoxygalactose transaminase/acetyltransferase-like isoleucine patch superfamily enzyme
LSPPYIHPTAIVEEGANIGDGAKIWHFVHVISGARVGAGAMLGKGVFVGARAVVGAGSRVQNGVSLFDGVELAEDVFIGPHAVFTNVKAPRAFESRKSEVASTKVGRGATIGAGAVIVCDNEIGAYAFVAAGAVVTKDVPPYALVQGNPAVQVGWVSRAGRRLPRGRIVACPETGERYLIESGSCRVLAEGETPDDARPVKLQDLVAETAHFERPLRQAFERVTKSASYVLGDEVSRLEAALAERIGAPHALGVSSGTDALLLALMTLGVGPGDEVITSPLSFFASAAVIARLGATPVFADVEAATGNIDPALVERAITAKTKAIMPVHLFGRPVDLKVFDVANGIPVVEDAAQAIFAKTARGQTGTLGAIGCFSFFPTKNLGALGDGGLCTMNDASLYERARTLRVQGAHKKYTHLLVGGNFRLDALQAAFIAAKLPEVDALNARRRENVAAYERGFAELVARGVLRTPGLVDGHVYHQYVVYCRERDRVAKALGEAGVETGVYYPSPLHLQPALSGLGYREGAFPVAEAACREALALPVHPWLDEGQRARVVEAIVDALRPEASAGLAT